MLKMYILELRNYCHIIIIHNIVLANNLRQYENLNKHWKILHYIFPIKEYNNLEANVSTLK